MGYTSYFPFKGKLDEVTKNGWHAVVPIVRDIIERHKDLLCLEYDETDKPPLVDEENFVIQFNGKGEDGHETFFVNLKDTEFAFCKTARKPYDIAVCEILLVLCAYIPGFDIGSDEFNETLQTSDENWAGAAERVADLYHCHLMLDEKGRLTRVAPDAPADKKKPPFYTVETASSKKTNPGILSAILQSGNNDEVVQAALKNPKSPKYAKLAAQADLRNVESA